MASEHTAAGGLKVSVQGAANLVSTRTATSTTAATLVAARTWGICPRRWGRWGERRLAPPPSTT
jgi:hypothetical protein